MTQRFMRTGMVAAGLVALAMPALAQFAKPDDAIRYRRAAFTVMGTHFGRVAAMANGRAPFDAKAVADNAEVATLLSKLPYAGFVEGSDQGETRALPKIWAEMENFRTLAAKMQDEMARLNTAAKSGNGEAIKAAVAATDRACMACHESYRKE